MSCSWSSDDFFGGGGVNNSKVHEKVKNTGANPFQPFVEWSQPVRYCRNTVCCMQLPQSDAHDILYTHDLHSHDLSSICNCGEFGLQMY